MGIHEECGVFGVMNKKKEPVAELVYYGLYALQHRGQESCGIVVNDDGVFSSYKDLGLVTVSYTHLDVYKRQTLLFTWIRYKKPDVSMTYNAALAGLVGITAGCDAVSPVGAAVIGIICGILIVCLLYTSRCV